MNWATCYKLSHYPSVIKHILSKSYYFYIFFDKHFFENVENRLFLGEKFDIWLNFKVTPIKNKIFLKNHIFFTFFGYRVNDQWIAVTTE